MWVQGKATYIHFHAVAETEVLPPLFNGLKGKPTLIWASDMSQDHLGAVHLLEHQWFPERRGSNNV